MPPILPDLQELAARFEGYDRIPMEAWDEFQRQKRAWREWYLRDLPKPAPRVKLKPR